MPPVPAPTAAVGRRRRRARSSTRRRSTRSGARCRRSPRPPVGANDIARWAIATYWPEPPPAVFLDAAAGGAGPVGRRRGAAGLRPVRLDARPPVGRRLAVGHGHRAGQAGAQRRPAQRLRRADPPRRRHRRAPAASSTSSSGRPSGARWCSSPASSAGRTRTASPSASASRRRSTTEHARGGLVFVELCTSRVLTSTTSAARRRSIGAEDLGGDLQGVVGGGDAGVDGGLHQHLDQLLLR